MEVNPLDPGRALGSTSFHDFVVQSDSAFDETMHGLHNPGERGHHIEIRCVLHAQTVSLVAPYFDVLEQKDTMLRLEAGCG